MNERTIIMYACVFLVFGALSVRLVFGATQFSDSFDTESSDWATWSSCGSGFCATGGSLTADGGGTSYFLTKQSDLDLSVCDTGTARLELSEISESGNIEPTDCIYVWFSSNSGGAYGDQTEVFCNDNPSATNTIDFPDSYEVSGFRFRFEGQNFDAGGEKGYIGLAEVTCDVSSSCTATCGDSTTEDIACGGQSFVISGTGTYQIQHKVHAKSVNKSTACTIIVRNQANSYLAIDS